MSSPGDLPDWETKFTQSAEVLVYSGVLEPGNFTPTLNVSQYQSIYVANDSTTQTVAQQLEAHWVDLNGDGGLIEFVSAPAYGAGLLLPILDVPVRNSQVNIYNPGSQPQNIVVVGTTRPLAGLLGTGYQDFDSFTNASATMIALSEYPVGQIYTLQQGQVMFNAVISGTTVKGVFGIIVQNVPTTPVFIDIMNTGEMQTVGANQRGSKVAILPASVGALTFYCTTGGTASLLANIVALGR